MKNWKGVFSEKMKEAGMYDNVKMVAEKAGIVTDKMQKLGSDALDAVTRQNIDDQVREHILLQNHYNDILAMKLSEALERIEKLERKVER